MKYFKNELTHLYLTIDRKEHIWSSYIESGKNWFAHIFNTFPNLLDLDFNQNHDDGRAIISIYDSSPIIYNAPNLVRLSITVQTFDDCLCLLDGRFPQLRDLCAVVSCIKNPTLIIEHLVR